MRHEDQKPLAEGRVYLSLQFQSESPSGQEDIAAGMTVGGSSGLTALTAGTQQRADENQTETVSSKPATRDTLPLARPPS